MRRLIFIHALLLTAICLKVQHTPLISAPTNKPTPAPPKLPAPHNQTQYLHFMDELNKITNQAGYLLRTLELSYNKKYPSTQTLLIKFNNGIEAIRKVLNKYHLHITHTINICPDPATFNRTLIDRYVLFTQQTRTALLTAIVQNPALEELHPPTLKMINLTDSYLLLLKQTLDGNFCHLPAPAPTPKPKKVIVQYKNNLDVNNWYYGLTNQVAYKAYLSKRAATNNLTTCPPAQPFVRDDQQMCFNCKPGSIYNLGAQKCQSCKPGEMLIVGKGTCEPCYGEQFIIDHQFVCKACAIESQELFDPATQKCYKCNVFSYLDATSRSCRPIQCPADKPKFNRELQVCQSCPPNEQINKLDPSQCLPIPKCTSELPLYDSATGKCKRCPEGQVYLQASKVCGLSTKAGANAIKPALAPGLTTPKAAITQAKTVEQPKKAAAETKKVSATNAGDRTEKAESLPKSSQTNKPETLPSKPVAVPVPRPSMDKKDIAFRMTNTADEKQIKSSEANRKIALSQRITAGNIAKINSQVTSPSKSPKIQNPAPLISPKLTSPKTTTKTTAQVTKETEGKDKITPISLAKTPIPIPTITPIPIPTITPHGPSKAITTPLIQNKNTNMKTNKNQLQTAKPSNPTDIPKISHPKKQPQQLKIQNNPLSSIQPNQNSQQTNSQNSPQTNTQTNSQANSPANSQDNSQTITDNYQTNPQTDTQANLSANPQAPPTNPQAIRPTINEIRPQTPLQIAPTSDQSDPKPQAIPQPQMKPANQQTNPKVNPTANSQAISKVTAPGNHQINTSTNHQPDTHTSPKGNHIANLAPTQFLVPTPVAPAPTNMPTSPFNRPAHYIQI